VVVAEFHIANTPPLPYGAVEYFILVEGIVIVAIVVPPI
jgi:hypothetical protein